VESFTQNVTFTLLWLCRRRLVYDNEVDHVNGKLVETYGRGRLVASLEPRRPGFTPRSVHLGFMVDIVALGQILPRVLRFSPVSVILLLLHIHSCIIWCWSMGPSEAQFHKNVVPHYGNNNWEVQLASCPAPLHIGTFPTVSGSRLVGNPFESVPGLTEEFNIIRSNLNTP
jgi:hypothetical protein